MGNTSITLGLLFGLTTLVSQVQPALIKSTSPPPAPPVAVVTADPVQDMMAIAVVETLRNRFAGNDVEFKFDSFTRQQASERDVEVSGAGQFRLDGGKAWLPMNYSALYDTATATIESPEISLGATPTSRKGMAVNTAALDVLVGRKLAEEFASQAVEFDLGTVRTVAGDARYATVEGSGVASFAGEGAAAVSVQGVFDRSTGQWLGVTYELGHQAA